MERSGEQQGIFVVVDADYSALVEEFLRVWPIRVEESSGHLILDDGQVVTLSAMRYIIRLWLLGKVPLPIYQDEMEGFAALVIGRIVGMAE